MDEDNWGDAGGAVRLQLAYIDGLLLLRFHLWDREHSASLLRTGVDVPNPFEENDYEEAIGFRVGDCVVRSGGSRVGAGGSGFGGYQEPAGVDGGDYDTG